MYLWSDEVTNHEGKSQHEHLHAVTCHLCTLLAINVNVVEMGRILRGQGDHGGVGHNSCKAVCQPFPHCLEMGNGNEWLSVGVDKIFTPQNLCITVQHSRHNMVAEQAKIPDTYTYISCTYMYIACTNMYIQYTINVDMYIHTIYNQYTCIYMITTDATRPWEST